ncbi:MAG: 6-hydroxycyclohex-1-ene-1-carbonyl-CoA dehydrogenase [Planctomycetota bacterium]|nr:MAG: 6-hydroxycyclohex-1-ene-1-carbonyl-CoA dehydrogenase [Planctomycetota bacterium]
MTEPQKPLVRQELDRPSAGPGEALLEVVGCGLCHTDIGFWEGGVRTRHPLPLALGHEISARVVETGEGAEDWQGKEVVVPAVLPCGECELCQNGRENACQHQSMPGNDFHGGFASHLVVPVKWLVDAGRLPVGIDLAEVSVLADAVTTPYQAMKRAQVQNGDAVILIGAGGIGSFGVQIASAFGAKVIAVDIQDSRLERAAAFGADGVVNTQGMDLKTARGAVRDTCRQVGFPKVGLKVLEMSGTPAGQSLAWSLLSPAGIVGIVGFCMDRVPVRLSNLMAFDAEAFGNWGCSPRLYGPALDLVRQGKVQLTPFIKRFPMDAINQVFEEVRAHQITERPVLLP